MWMLAKVAKNGQTALNIERGPTESECADFCDASINLER